MAADMMKARRAWAWPTLVGVALGFAGATLDFYSGYLLYEQSGMPGSVMGAASPGGAGQVWGIGIALLGVVLAVTASMVALRSTVSMKDAGGLMALYGAVMLFIGGSMILGVTSMASGVSLPGAAMIVVGVLMLTNGVAMRRVPMA